MGDDETDYGRIAKQIEDAVMTLLRNSNYSDNYGALIKNEGMTALNDLARIAEYLVPDENVDVQAFRQDRGETYVSMKYSLLLKLLGE